jgi:hypothetical protein
MPATGTLSLFIDDEKVGEGDIMTQPGNFSLVGEGLNVGKDPAEPVTDDYAGTSPASSALTVDRSGGSRAHRDEFVSVSRSHWQNTEEAKWAMWLST